MKLVTAIALAVVVALGVVSIAFILTIKSAHAAEFVWKHPGADPYATSKEEAMKTRASAFRKLGFPSEVIVLLMEASKTPGEPVKLMMRDKLSAMLSKGGVVHQDVVIDWESPMRSTEPLVAPAERWQIESEGQIYTAILFDICNNWSSIVAPVQTPKSPPAGEKKEPVVTRRPAPVIWIEPEPNAEGKCPDVYTYKVNFWEPPAMDLPGVKSTHVQEGLANRFIGEQHVSRKHGGQFRKAADAGKLHRSTTAHDLRVSLIMTPEAHGGEPTITSEHIIGDVKAIGLYVLKFPRTQLEKWDAIRVIPADDKGTKSPPKYPGTGLHELRFFNHLPGTTLGEWDNNPVPDCIMNGHFIEE